ncbi:hypothetical protein KM537_s4gp1 [Fusarium graminearum dsRNA mycovirus 2]|uniref:Uncharacterized protein n=1 Tax=Fusarium graminearum dsRNA mycovirus 2 TaxID=254946 RepID=G4WH33_9VIRU|nr:hypothetical protein KM537_s4gp1 [Fusarium graminearum dsRNA mycovirus 2]ADW08805.1 hypothetical protein [Fusarium graminearum dsRNA mycovirus 2]
MTTTFWKSTESTDSNSDLAEQRAVHSTEYAVCTIYQAWGLPSTPYSLGGKPDQWEFTTKDEGSGPSKLTGNVVDGFGTLFSDRLFNLPSKREVTFFLHSDTAIEMRIINSNTFDRLENSCICVEVCIVSRASPVQKHRPVVLHFWVYDEFSGGQIKVVLVETAYDYSPFLRIDRSGIGAAIRSITSIHTLGQTGTLNGSNVFSVVPWDANKLQSCSVKDLRRLFVSTSNGKTAKLKTPLDIKQAAEYPLLIYLGTSNDHENATRMVLSGGAKTNPIRYVRYWHNYSLEPEDARTRSAVMTANDPSAMLPSNVLVLATNGGKQVTATCVAVRVRADGRYLYSTMRRNCLPYTDQVKFTSIVPSAHNLIMERSFAVDNWGSIMRVNTNNRPVVVHTAVTEVIRNAALGTTDTTVYVRHVLDAFGTICSLMDRTAGLSYEIPQDKNFCQIRWKHDALALKGTLFIASAVNPGTCLLGVLGSWQNWAGPGSGGGQIPQSQEYWYPIDGRGGKDCYGELMYLDGGFSLLGRYLYQDVINSGQYLDLTSTLVPKALRDDGLITDNLRVYVGPHEGDKVNFMLDIEYTDLPGGDSKTPTAIGYCAVQQGESFSSGLSTMHATTLDGYGLITDPKGSAKLDQTLQQRVGKHRQLSKRYTSSNLWEDLAVLQTLALSSNSVQLWAKGADNDAAFLVAATPVNSSSCPTWNSIKHEGAGLVANGTLLDIGGELPKFAALAKRHKVSSEHNPCIESALFAIEAGIWRKTPDLATVRLSTTSLAEGLADLLTRLYSQDVLIKGDDGAEWVEGITETFDIHVISPDHPAREALRIVTDRVIAASKGAN